LHSVEKPNCMKCKYFYITWNNKQPNGCRMYRIVTKHIPSLEVLRHTGTNCIGFEEKFMSKK